VVARHSFRLLVLVLVGACSHADDYLVVTVEARPAVRDARSITVVLSNGGTTRTDSLALSERPFPVTFSVSAPGRTGELEISVDATDQGDAIVGHGNATSPVDADHATVLLDSTDFVVNTDYAGDQFPSDDFEDGGFQVAARPDGTWTAVFRDDCPSGPGSCSVFARQFDQTGKPVSTEAAAGTNAFAVTARPTDNQSIPAVAASATAAVALWNFTDPGAAAASGVACRAWDGTGHRSADQIAIENVLSHVVSVAALASAGFVATWRIIGPGAIDEIHMAMLGADCALRGPVQVVAQGITASDFLHRGQVASSADHALFAWVTNGDVHVRMASSAGAFTAADTLLVPQTQTDEIRSVRAVAAPGGGFVVGARWAQKAPMTGPGKIEIYRVDPSGARVGPPVLVSDRTGSDFSGSESFAMASRPDGILLVAWHACGLLGDDSLCGVFGRILRDSGDAITDAFVIPTSTPGDQVLPSVAPLPDGFVVVWSDASMKRPDPAGRSVRARIVYLPSGT
jgi:hypothetical protein